MQNQNCAANKCCFLHSSFRLLHLIFMPQRNFEIKLGKSGWSLTELLCVIAIIAILSSMYLGALARAFIHVKKFLAGM